MRLLFEMITLISLFIWCDHLHMVFLFADKTTTRAKPSYQLSTFINIHFGNTTFCLKIGKKYTSGPRYWNVPVLVNTGTFLVYQYCLKMCYLRPLEHAGVIQKLTILERKNGLVLVNTRVPVSGTWSILFPKIGV